MKIVAVIGSMREGNTNKMVCSACSVFNPNEVTIINLAKMKLGFCTGCLRCDEEKKCHLDDDMQKYMSSISEADAYIFASPVRWSLLSGEMKTFFDRLNPFATTGDLENKTC